MKSLTCIYDTYIIPYVRRDILYLYGQSAAPKIYRVRWVCLDASSRPKSDSPRSGRKRKSRQSNPRILGGAGLIEVLPQEAHTPVMCSEAYYEDAVNDRLIGRLTFGTSKISISFFLEHHKTIAGGISRVKRMCISIFECPITFMMLTENLFHDMSSQCPISLFPRQCKKTRRPE